MSHHNHNNSCDDDVAAGFGFFVFFIFIILLIILIACACRPSRKVTAVPVAMVSEATVAMAQPAQYRRDPMMVLVSQNNEYI